MVQSSKTQKKRKKKSKPKVEKCNSEDSSIIFEFDTGSPAAKDEDQRPELDSPVSSTEQVYEIQLTDDLADSLVNPPTDPEISEGEESAAACDHPIVGSIQSNTGTEIENNSSSEPAIEAVTTPSSATENTESVDREVRDITLMIHPETTPCLQDTDNSLSESKDTKPTNRTEEKKEIPITASVVKPIDSQSKNEGANKTEKKSKNKKPKKGSSKSVLNAGDEEKDKIAKEPIVESKSAASPLSAPQVSGNENKKSWSSVIKSTLPPPATAEPAEPVASPKPEKKTATGNKKENSAEQRAKRRAAADEKKKKKTSIERSDSWENIPVSVTQQEDSWEKTEKKGKKKSKRKTEDRKEKVTFAKEEAGVETETQPPTVPAAKTEPSVAEKVEAAPVPSSEAVTTSTEAALTKEEAEAETEKRKLKKRRKKADSGEPEDGANSHRVLICDEQVGHAVLPKFIAKCELRRMPERQ